MKLFSYFSRTSRLKRKLKKMMDGDDFSISPESILLLVEYFHGIIPNINFRSKRDLKITLTHSYKDLLNAFQDSYDFISEGEEPRRKIGMPDKKDYYVDEYFWDSKEGDDAYVQKLEILLNLVWALMLQIKQCHETEGKAAADYRFEQIYFPLCDLVTIFVALCAEI